MTTTKREPQEGQFTSVKRNIRLTLSYRGDHLQGYQRQPHGETVEGCLLKAWKILTREDARFINCSRLDAGVHADHFVLNLLSQSSLDCDALLRGMNGILWHVLERRICISDCQEVPLDFHSRFHAVGKHYRYLIWYGRSRHASVSNRVWHLRKRDIDFDLQPCVKLYEGTKDFSAFRSHDCQSAETIKTIFRAEFWIHPELPELGVVDFWGRGFLKNMIRNLVGSAVDVGGGNLSLADITAAFEHGDRTRLGPCAPGHALCLKRVFYDEEEFQEAIARGPGGVTLL